MSLRDGEDQGAESTRDEHGPEDVERLHPSVVALAEEHRHKGQRHQSDRDVDEEDPLPGQRVREDSTQQDAGGGSEAAHRTPDAEGDVAVPTLAEGGHHDGQSGR